MMNRKRIPFEASEMKKLIGLLEAAGIPFEYHDESIECDAITFDMWHYHIYYPVMSIDTKISVIQGYGSYGGSENLLEALVAGQGEPMGYMTAENAYEHIYAHWIGGDA